MMKSFLVRTGLLLTTILGLALNATLASAQVELRENHPGRYYVKHGDTLWDISSQFLESPWQWPEIWHDNTQIDNPHLIYPGDVLVLKYVNGEPVLQVERDGSEVVNVVQPQGTNDSATQSDEPPKVYRKQTVKLKPQARMEPIGNAIPAVPLDAIQAYLTDTRIVELVDLTNAPHIIAAEGQRLITGKGDKIYARDLKNQWEDVVSSYGIFRRGRDYVDAQTGEILGIEAINLGNARVVGTEGDLATLKVNATTHEVRLYDKLLSSEERRIDAIFYPKGPTEEVEGTIIRVFGSMEHAAEHDVVAINRGQREGIEEGHVLSIYRQGEQVKDRVSQEFLQLPDEKKGLMIIFRTFEKVSYGLILSSSTALKVGDRVSNPRFGS